MDPCLYCGRTDRRFTSIEHIFPQGMGNDEKILPRGVVCDECNNGVLSQLDATLLDFEPVAFMRMLIGIRNKAGKLPVLHYPNMRIERFPDNRIRIDLQGGERGLEELSRDDRTGNVHLNLHFRGKKPYAPAFLRKLARAFYKVGLGLVYLDHGLAFCQGTRYDEVRQIILGGVPDFHGYVVFGNRITPCAKVETTYRFLQVDSVDLTLFEMTLFGLPVGFDLERRRFENPDAPGHLNFTLLTF